MKTFDRYQAFKSFACRGTAALSALACMVGAACSSNSSPGAATAGTANGGGNATAGAATNSSAGAPPVPNAAGSTAAMAGSANGGAGGTGGVVSGAGSEAGGAPGAGAGMGGGQADVVTKTSSSFMFKHFPIETDANRVWSGSATAGTQVSTTAYDTVVLENRYLKVTLLPSYGGRILSIVHKPTGRELLYQNPIGTPYLMTQDIFYYDYLVIMGGIFPSFPEPEHGRYWNQPYQLQVVSESPEAITVRMSRKDDLDVTTGVPARYDVGRTDILVELDVTLRAGRASLQLDTKLTNTKTTAVPKFEYWTVTTLAPGSTPGQTAITKNTRILAKMDKVHLFEKDWDWFASAEERVSGEVFKWNNLSHFENWKREGTAFASPNYQANWNGLINYDNDIGILCVSDPGVTPGLKLWTFGMGSLTEDVNDSSKWLRPAIEMWHGFTPEFWNRGTLAASEVRKSSTSYFPTMGLKEVTAASENGAVYLSSTKSGTDTVLSAVATLTVPNQTVKAILRVGSTVVAEKDLVVEAAKATTVDVKVASSAAPSAAMFSVEFLQGATSLLAGQTVLP